MKRLMLSLLVTLMLPVSGFTAQGVIDVESAFGVKETGDRFELILKKKGMTLFNRIEHSDAAEKVGVALRKTTLIIFGNPKVGSPLMQCQQSVAIDLPQKALIWQDEKGKVWLSYNDPRHLEQKHDIADCEQVIAKIEKALAGLTKAATTQ